MASFSLFMSYLPEWLRRCQSFWNPLVQSDALGGFARLFVAGFFKAIH